MSSKKETSDSPEPSRRDSGGPSQRPESTRELIVCTSPRLDLRARPEGVSSASGEDVSSLIELLQDSGATLEPLFGLVEERMLDRAASLDMPLESAAEMASFYTVVADDDKLDALAEELRHQRHVEAAYVKPPVELAVTTEEPPSVAALPELEGEPINAMLPSAESPPVHTPDFRSRQIYLNPAPAGIDAYYAHRFPGGRGAGVRVIDLEWGWRFTHEDLRANQGGVLAGGNSSNDNHGTAVIGEISGDRNNFGILGISPDAYISAVSFLQLPTARAIRLAADRLRAGDIMLLEVHRAGPRFAFQGRADQRGYIAIEWWPDDYAAIRYAASRGVVVVEAAGNGAENLDDPLYDRRPAQFPVTWRNPFNPANPTSMAVLVGAGAPPPGTHGRDHGPDRSRLGFSNFGRRVDCQGWGREVTTAGYGDLQGGTNRDEWYTDQFSGTSSASPIVVGALACVQGIRRARQMSPLGPLDAIRLLRRTGSPQTDAPGRPRTQRIGNRPNLRQIIDAIPRATVRSVALYRYWNPRIGDHFYTTNWRELGGGRHGWRYEGVQCHVFPRRADGTVPLYRYWNPRIGDHFYTTNWRELGSGRHGWRYEGIQGWVHRRRVQGTRPLYRYWNPQIGDHFYTTSWRELGGGRHGWRYEGVQCYVFPRMTSLPPATDQGSEASELESHPPEEVSAASFAHEPEDGLARIPESGPGTFDTVDDELQTSGVLDLDAWLAPSDQLGAGHASPFGSEHETADSFRADGDLELGASTGEGFGESTFALEAIGDASDSFQVEAEGGGETTPGSITINLSFGRGR